MVINTNDLKIITNLADMIQGEINRMCVTDCLSELDDMFLIAHADLVRLHHMIYDLKFKEDKEDE